MGSVIRFDAVLRKTEGWFLDRVRAGCRVRPTDRSSAQIEVHHSPLAHPTVHTTHIYIRTVTFPTWEIKKH